jgi:hypothetical protein
MAAAAGRTSASGVKARTPGPALQEVRMGLAVTDDITQTQAQT